METDLFSINNIRNMEIIDISTGTKLGFARDIKVDCENYKIISLIIPMQKSSWFGKMDVLEIPWSSIVKVGLDVILVDNVESTKE